MISVDLLVNDGYSIYLLIILVYDGRANERAVLGGRNSAWWRNAFNVQTARVSIMRDELQLYRHLLTMSYHCGGGE